MQHELDLQSPRCNIKTVGLLYICLYVWDVYFTILSRNVLGPHCLHLGFLGNRVKFSLCSKIPLTYEVKVKLNVLNSFMTLKIVVWQEMLTQSLCTCKTDVLIAGESNMSVSQIFFFFQS